MLSNDVDTGVLQYLQAALMSERITRDLVMVRRDEEEPHAALGK